MCSDSIIPAIFSIVPKLFWNNPEQSMCYQNSQNYSHTSPQAYLGTRFLKQSTAQLAVPLQVLFRKFLDNLMGSFLTVENC